MKKKLAIINLLSVIVVIAVNYYAQIFKINGVTVGEVSNKYDTLFTPAGYAFAIWGVIFLAILGFALFQVRRAFFSKKDSPFIEQTGYWFAIANLCNAAWVIAFSYEILWLSVILIFALFVSLMKIVFRTNMERWDAPIEVIAFVWWPICFYSGWIAVASIANVAAFLVKMDLAGSQLTQIIFTMVMTVIAVYINNIMTNLRNMREFAMVGAWALVAIFMKNKDDIVSVAYLALLGAIILAVTAGLHAYRNRATSPMVKLQQRRKGEN